MRAPSPAAPACRSIRRHACRCPRRPAVAALFRWLLLLRYLFFAIRAPFADAPASPLLPA